MAEFGLAATTIFVNPDSICGIYRDFLTFLICAYCVSPLNCTNSVLLYSVPVQGSTSLVASECSRYRPFPPHCAHRYLNHLELDLSVDLSPFLHVLHETRRCKRYLITVRVPLCFILPFAAVFRAAVARLTPAQR